MKVFAIFKESLLIFDSFSIIGPHSFGQLLISPYSSSLPLALSGLSANFLKHFPVYDHETCKQFV